VLISKSFVDVLFILLCGTIVLLSESIRVGSIDTAPAKVGHSSVSKILADDVRPVVVNANDLVFEEQHVNSAADLIDRLSPTVCVLLVPGDEGVTHHRVMYVWSRLQDLGVTVKLGAVATQDSNEAVAKGSGTTAQAAANHSRERG